MDKEILEQKKANNKEFAKIASQAIDIKNKTKNNTSKLNNIKRYLQNPKKNSAEIQELMDYFESISGILQAMLDYKANLYTLDHYLICKDATKYKTKDKINNAYKKACTELEKYNVKFNMRWMLRNTMSVGELYMYCIRDKDTITLVSLSPKVCKICGATGYHQWYKVNLNAIDEDDIKTYPEEIRKVYKSFKNGVKNKNIDSDGWYKVKPENSCAFNLHYLQSKNLPLYTSLLSDMARLKNVKDLDDLTNQINNFKILQMLIPTDDNGDILLDAEDARMYLEALKNILPEDGIGAFASPMKVTPITLTDVKDKDLNYSTKLVDSMFDNAGISQELFNGSKNNNMAVMYSAKMDGVQSWALIEAFRLWFNELFEYDTSLKNFMLCICDSTIFDKEDKIKLCASNLAIYESRLKYLALLGYSPLVAFNILIQEELMGIDDMMICKLTSHTASSDDVGRPQNKDNEDVALDVPQEDN